MLEKILCYRKLLRLLFTAVHAPVPCAFTFSPIFDIYFNIL